MKNAVQISETDLVLELKRFGVHKNMGKISLTVEASDIEDEIKNTPGKTRTIVVVGNYAELRFEYRKSLYAENGEGELWGWEYRPTAESLAIYRALRKNAPELVLTIWND